MSVEMLLCIVVGGLLGWLLSDWFINALAQLFYFIRDLVIKND